MSVVVSEHLPLLASAPDGVQKLRGLILELAVRGKLVPQDPDDEPASELLKRIAQERARLEAEGVCKKSKATPVWGEDEQPFSSPEGWQFTRLGALLLGISSGGTPSKNNPSYWNGDIPWASVKDLGFGDPLTGTRDRITKEGLAAGSFLAVTGTILVCTRMGLGKIGEAMIDVAINQDLKALQLSSEFNKQYFINFFKTLSIKGSGMTVAGIKQDELLGFIVPVPPLAEQHRIVAKIDELMDLCDRLEAEQTDAASAHARLVETLLDTLTKSIDTTDLAANWQRLAKHFDTIFTTEASIDALKQTLLQLAVMGKLVPQNPNEETASQLLKHIADEQIRLATKVGRKTKPQTPVVCEAGPFELPDGWVWTTIESISSVGTGTTPSRTNPAYFNPPHVPWVTSGETRDSYISTTAERVSTLALEETSLTIYPVGTLIVAMYGQGKTRGQVSELEIEAATNQACAAIVPVLPNVAIRKYIKLFFRKIYDEIREEAAGGAQPNLNVGKIKATLIPLPPLAEQDRIVAKIDYLMSLCDRLKADLVTARQHQAALADTLIVSALVSA